MLAGHRLRTLRSVSALFGIVSWGALVFSGVDPVVVGLAIGLAAPAYSPARDNLEAATGLFRRFREQPTPELARSATAGLIATLSPNERLQSLYHPWTSYFIVPLFALANAGIHVDGQFLASAYVAPITLGVLIGYVAGKPAAVLFTSWLITRVSRGMLRPPVGWAAVAGSGTIAGVGFTVSVLVATLAFRGEQLEQAKLGILTAAIVASLVTWLVYRITALLPAARRARALLGETDQLVDLSSPVDADRDHIRGPENAPVTVVEYGDFQCPYCGMAETSVRELIEDVNVRFVWRHLPLADVHPQARLAAEAAEAAGAQGFFWQMHDLLIGHQDRLRAADLRGYAVELGLDVDRFERDLERHTFQSRVAADVASADLSGVSGTPTFFINDERHYGAYDIETLNSAVATAYEQAGVGPRRR
jgi:protein-disulfide isomerase